MCAAASFILSGEVQRLVAVPPASGFHSSTTHRVAVKSIQINRAPVMTLWAVVVAERLGHSHDEALTLGKAVTGLNAHSKAKAIGLIQSTDTEPTRKKTKQTDHPTIVQLLGRHIPVVKTKEGVRALTKDEPVAPASVERYLSNKFKDSLPVVRAAMQKLAKSRTPRTLELKAYSLYEQFRPDIPAGEAGWGKAGTLSLETLEALAMEPQSR